MQPLDPQYGSPFRQASRVLAENRLDDAVGLLVGVCEREPLNVEAWVMRAFVHGRMGEYARVIACCESVLAVEPLNARALLLMASAHAALGNHSEALEGYQEALVIAPDDPAVMQLYGNGLLAVGRVAEAIEHLRHAVEQAPGLAGAHCSLARAYTAASRFTEAVHHYRLAIAQQPQLFDAYLGLGEVLNRVHDFDAAEACFREALVRWPTAIELYSGLRFALEKQGNLDGALQASRQALRLKPHDPEIIAGEAAVLARKGEAARAYQRLRPVLYAGTATVSVAEVYASLCGKHGSREEAISLCRDLLRDTSHDPIARQRLHFVLGNLYDAGGAYDDAFREYEQANAIGRVPFDVAEQARGIDRLIAAFGDTALARMPRARRRSERPVLIVGMPRSGTTLVEQILAGHRQVYGGGELRDINRLVRSLPPERYPDRIASFDQEAIDGFARRYLARLADLSPDAQRVTDKMPHNFLHLGLVALMLPGARVIHCVRDARDTCLSIYFQNFGPGHGYATDLANLGTYYVGYKRLMAHWRRALDLALLDVAYTDLVTETERVSRHMVEFLGLPWDDRCLDFHRSDRVVTTASHEQVRRPIYQSSLGRWRNYERFLGPLCKALSGEAGP
jgi:tetratricopeptide (TPR) repeat protein